MSAWWRDSGVTVEVDPDLVERTSNTMGFDVDEYLVTRRGTNFRVVLKAWNKLTAEAVKLIYDFGTPRNEFPVEITSQNSRVSGTEVYITIPADTPVSVYKLVVSGTTDFGNAFEVTLKRKVVVLFNAWSRSDGAYLDDEDQRQEYVLNTQGRLYAGSTYGMPWNLALYRPNSLRAVLMLLESYSSLSIDERRNPILVAREMSALVNVQDEGGVIVGRWDGNYQPYRSPSSWTGSGEILEQFYTSGGTPVRYGQCWVFSGVLLTVLRILGIPSRSITNFSSAHDTNRNRTIDRYKDESGRKISYLSSGNDSIWNFHVWNEVWLTRPDLPGGFDGWQVVDATPQEESPQGGGYRTGPAPLTAVKEGNSVNYDTNFVIAEVNADVKEFTVGPDGVPRLVSVDTRSVGQDISTKAVGSSRRVDVTLDYKYREGTEKEREALFRGLDELVEGEWDVEFTVPKISANFGQDVQFAVKASNKSRQHRIKGTITCEATTYTGRVLEVVQELPVDIKVNKGRTETVSMTVRGTVFSRHSGTKVYLKFSTSLAVQGTSQIFTDTTSFAPDPPTLTVTAPATLHEGEQAIAVVTFTNPLSRPMRNVTLNVESELLETYIIRNVGSIAAGAEFSYSFTITGLRQGPHTLVVGLESDSVEMVTGETQVTVIERPADAIPPTPPRPTAITVEKFDFDTPANGRAHKTGRYDYDSLVVRRGQSFTVTVTMGGPLTSAETVSANAVFQLTANPYHSPYVFEVDAVAKATGKMLTVELKPPADAAIGEYEVLLTLNNQGKITMLDKTIKVVVLFNPWCIDDSCHYPNESDLEEYVLNNRGRIWVGSAKSNYGKPWQFAQFQKHSLEVALWVLAKLPSNERGDPVTVTRHISAWTNVQDESGILVGNWSGDYSGGTSPLDWTGSGDILYEFNKSKQPVSYGQCWVFSGVETTLLRCLGLAARSITNFDSAHDTHFNRAIDKFFDEDGEEISTGDSIWNFHVWNEAWMSRPDLPGGATGLAAGFGGWQVLDATPQEESPQGGGFRLGPSPRQAIKLGRRTNFDVEFVISEVNADVRFYTINADNSRTLTGVNTTHVGKNISTKAVGSDARHDVTLDYKFPERSTAERAAVLVETDSEKKLGVTIEVSEEITIGQSFPVVATITNKTDTTRELKFRLHGRATLYTGAPGQIVKQTEKIFILSAGESRREELVVNAVDYLRILEAGNFMTFVAMAVHSADKISVVKQQNVRLKTPEITITVPSGGLKLYQPVSIRASFTNPLGTGLTGGQFYLNGEGHLQDTTTDVSYVAPRSVASAVLNTIPVRTGPLKLVVRFICDQLSNVMGDQDVDVA